MKKLLGITLLLGIACGYHHPPPPPSPPMAVWHVFVHDSVTDRPIVGAEVSFDGMPVSTNPDGYAAMSLIIGPHGIVAKADHYIPASIDIDLQNDTTTTVSLDPNIPPLDSLLPHGQFLRAGIRPWTLIGTTDFKLLKLYLDGHDIRPVLNQRLNVGFNTVRVFGTCQNMFPLHPQEIPDYFARLDKFATLLQSVGLRGEFVVFADAPQVMPQLADQQQFYQSVVNTLRPHSNMMLELGNELDQNINTINTQAFTRPSGILASHGSGGSLQPPIQPFWDYATFHTNDAFEWWRKVGHGAMETWAGPTVANENTRAPDRLQSLQQAYDAAAGGALLAAGSTFHSVRGRSSDLWDGLELDLAKAWVAGAKSVPLACQDGGYRHRDDLEGPADLRVYQRGVDPMCIVHIRK